MEYKLLVVLAVFQLLLTVGVQGQCNTGDVCLADGSGYHEGRVQVCSSGVWGTVCDDGWSSSDAIVVCRQLGYSTSGATALSFAYFGEGTGIIAMDDVDCSGAESQLTLCSHTISHNCGHSEDASVRCSQTRQTQSSGICYQYETYLAYRYVQRIVSTIGYTACGFLWLSRCSKTTYKTITTQEAYADSRYVQVCCSGYIQNGQSCTPVCSGGCGNGICTSPGKCTCNIGWTGSRCSTACCFPQCVNGQCSSPGHCTCNYGWTGSLCDTPICTGGCGNGRCTSPGLCTCNSGWTGTRCTIAICSDGCGNGICTRPEYCTCNSGWTGTTCTSERCIGREGAARLAGGTSLSGRLELCVGGEWGTVCDDFWDNTDASVACYQLGFSRNNAVGMTFGIPGTGLIHMDDVRCTGLESTLFSCLHTTSHNHNCAHSEDAGVTCQQRICGDGALRIVSSAGMTGSNVRKGRVEVCINETWGTVCDQSWSREDAKVVCGQLGFLRSGASSYTDALFGQGIGPILFNNVACTGLENSFLDCSSNIGTTGTCSHLDDAGVSCRTSGCSNGELSLVDGLSENEGRLEICYNGQWGTVCDDEWSQSSTNVACRQMGIHDSTHVIELSNHLFSPAPSSVSILLDDVVCTGSETTLLSCSHRPIGQDNCGHHEDIGLRCGVCSEGDVRLVNGASHNEGRVEVCLNGRWGTVCDDGWTTFDAQVTCRQLGYTISGATALSGATFTPNFILPIVMDAVACDSTESRLIDCAYQDVQNLRFCSHTEDARLRCTLSPPGPPGFVGTQSVTATSIAKNWAAPAPSVPPSAAVTRYSVTCTAPGKSSRSVYTATTSANVTGLSPSTDYSCCVVADSSVGTGVSICQSSSTNEISPSGPPLNVRGFATTPHSISLSWQPPSFSNGVIREYRITVTEQVTSMSWQLTSTSLSQQVTGLHPYYYYSVIVSAVTVSAGPYSTAILIQTFSDVPSAAPSVPVSSHITNTSFRLIWQAPPPQNWNGELTYYRLRFENQRTGSNTYSTLSSSHLIFNATSLTPYTIYDCSVAASTVNGTGPYSSAHSVQTLEDAPSAPPLSVQHTVLTNTRLLVEWSPPSTQYQNGIIRHYSLELNDTTGLRTVTGSSYTVTNLHPYYIYNYRIAAFTIALGPYSGWMSVRMPSAPPSGPPLNLRVVQQQLTSITVAWQPPTASQQNGVITSYTVHITPPEGGSPYTLVTTGLSLTATSLIGNSPYSFAVAASTDAGTGPYTSPSLSIRTPPPAVTSAPQSVNLLVLDSERILVTWSEPPASEQSGTITGYTVRIKEIETENIWEENSNLLRLTLINLHPFYTYQVQVMAVPDSGSGIYSDGINATTLPSVPSGAPIITHTETTSHSVLLRWTALPENQHNGIITGYIIDGADISVSVAAHILEYSFEALPYREYSLRVAAVNSVGTGPFSAVEKVRTQEDVPTHHPRHFMGVALSSTSIILTWDPPPEEHHNGEIDSYTVLCIEIESGGSLSEHMTTATNITITGLHPFYTYECRVSAMTVGHGPFSDTTNTTTLEDAPSGSPMNLSVGYRGPDFVSLSWMAPALDEHNGIIRHYLIYAQPIYLPSSSVISHRTPSSTTSHNITGLQPYTSYQLSVAAVTIAAGPSSDSVDVQTTEDIPSDSPFNVTLTALSSYALNITWQPPPAGTQNGVIRYYIVNITNFEMATLINTHDDATLLTVDNLHPYYLYTISVAAVSVGVGPFSFTKTILMPEAEPSSPPEEVRGSAQSSTSINIQWDPPLPEHQNGEIDSYIVLCTGTGGTMSRHTTSNTQITINDLHPYYTYSCNVSAVTVAMGPFTHTIDVKTLEDVPSAAPYDIAVDQIGQRNVTLTWTKPSAEHQNGVIRTYHIHVIPTEPWLQPSRYITPSAETSYTVQDLHPYSNYIINVAAVTTGPGPNSTNIHAQTEEDAPSIPPMGLFVRTTSPYSLSVYWDSPPDEFINGILRSYSIRVITVATRNITLFTSLSTNITIEPLHPFYSYLVSVAANTIKQGPYTPEIIVTMPEAEPSGSPEVTVIDATSDTIHLHIIPPPDQDQNGIITGYIIEYFSSRETESILIEIDSTQYMLEAVPYTNYTLRVTSLNSVGQGPFSEYLLVETLQDAPSHEPILFMIVDITSSSIQLTWEPPPLEYHNGMIVSYTILCIEQQESDEILTIYSTMTTDITINQLHPYYTYSCKVSAVTVSQGPFSDSINITTLEDVPSGRPYNLTAFEITPYSLSISWNPPDPSQWNGIIRQYLVHVMPIISAASTTTYITQSSSTSFMITDLRSYTFYQITVAAVTIGPGPNSTIKLIETGEDIPSAPPQDLTANPISSRELSLTWRPPPLEERHGLIRYYSIIVLEVTTRNKTIYTTPDSTPHLIIRALHPYYVYYIGVKAATMIGLSHFTQEVRVQMPEEAPSSSPLNLTVIQKGSSYALLEWLLPLDAHHNGKIRYYVINLKDGNSSETIMNLTSPSAQPSINIGSLQPDTAYSCSVSAVTIAPGPFSTSVPFTTDPDIPGTVQSLRATALSSRSMNISWQPPLEQEIADQIEYYQVNVTHVGGWFEYVSTTVSLSVVLDSLHPNYVYQCSVTFSTSNGLGPLTHVLLQLPPEVPTGYPQNVTAVASDSNTLHIYWSPPPVVEQNGDIMKYGINITDIESGQISQYHTIGPITSYIVYNLHPHTMYRYTVTAITAVGNGPYSPPQTILMPSAAPSSAPSNLSVDEIGSTYALLRWSPPPEDQHNGIIQHYRVYLNTSQGTHLDLTTANSERHILLNSLVPDTKYTCTVAAVTVSPGPKSTAIHFTTNSSAPETVQALTGTILSSRSVNISWQPPLNERNVIDYHITLTSLYRNSQIPTQNVTVSTSIVMTMLDPGTFYLCTVAARTSAGLQQSLNILIKLPPDVPSGYPHNILAVTSDPRTLHLAWSTPLQDERNGEIIQYGINLTDIQSGEVMHFFAYDSVTSVTIQHLHPHYYYNYTLTAFTSAGNGPYSPTDYVQMPQDAPDASPVDITVTNVRPGVVSLLWSPPPEDKHNGDIIGYVIRVINLEQLMETEDIEIDDITSSIISDLRTFHPYNFSIAARTIAGLGPFSAPLSIVTLHGASSAPIGVTTERASATQIKVSWPLLTVDEETQATILYYTVKYYSLDIDSRLRRNVEHNIQFIDTMKNITIEHLAPTLTYRVAVAANTVSGRGNYSEEITVGLSENSLFQLFLSGAIECQQWVLYHIDAKLDSTRDAISIELEGKCQCNFPSDYILLYQPHCITAHPDWLILWGRIIATNYTSSVDILFHLQEWSDSESKVVVEGVHLTSLKFCTVVLNEGEPPYCETSTTSNPESIDSETESQPVDPSVTYIIVGVVVTMLMMFVVLVCILTVSCYRKRKIQERQLRFHSTHPLHTFDTPSISNSSAAAKLSKADSSDSNIYEQTDSIYESILDNESPYSQIPPNPPPPLPNSDIPIKKLAEEQQMASTDIADTSSEGYSRTQFFPCKDLSQRCPSPVNYSMLKPNASAEPMPGCDTYEEVKETVLQHNQLESGDDYVPMYSEDDVNYKEYDAGYEATTGASENLKTTYENLVHNPFDPENDYQVPRPQETTTDDDKNEYQVPQPQSTENEQGMRQPCYVNYAGKGGGSGSASTAT